MSERLDCPSDEVLARFLDGRLDASEEATFLRHLDACASCFELVAVVADVGDRAREGLLPAPTSAYTRAVEQFVATLAPAAPQKSPWKGFGPSVGGAMGSLVAALALRFPGGSAGPMPRFAAGGGASPTPHSDVDPRDVRSIDEALDEATPTDHELLGNSVVLSFRDHEALERFLDRLPHGLADRAVVEGNHLTFSWSEQEPERFGGHADSYGAGAHEADPTATAGDPGHTEPTHMRTSTPSPAPIEQAPTTIGVHGVEGRSGDIHQSYSDTCAVRCQQLVLHQYGIDVPQEQLMDEAHGHGWYRPGGGTPMKYVGDLLIDHGVPISKYQHANIFNLTSELAQGHKVIIGVDSGDLWKSHPVLESLRQLAGISSADHAVIVSGIDTTDPEHVKVIVTDPGTGDVAKAYPINEFLSAWKDSGFFMVATQLPAPLAFNPEMVNFDYHLGHVQSLGHLSYEEFDRQYAPIRHLEGHDALVRTQAEQMLDAMDDDHGGHHHHGHGHGLDHHDDHHGHGGEWHDATHPWVDDHLGGHHHHGHGHDDDDDGSDHDEADDLHDSGHDHDVDTGHDFDAGHDHGFDFGAGHDLGH